MILENKTTKQRISCTPEEYATLQQAGFGRFWAVIDRGEIPAGVEIPKTIPKEIIAMRDMRKAEQAEAAPAQAEEAQATQEDTPAPPEENEEQIKPKPKRKYHG